MLAGLLLLLRLATDPLAPSLAADLDGDGREETVTAAPRRGSVRLEVRDAAGHKLADVGAPAPMADVVRVELSAGSLGSSGALVAVIASTDASECVSIWRLRGKALARVPLRDAGGKDLPDCGLPAAWTYRWEQESSARPAAFVRERSETTDHGALRTRDVYAFAGFSLDTDTKRSAREIEGVPIPKWYDARLYSTSALETLYARYDLSRMRAQPTLEIVTDRERGLFALRFSGATGSLTAPVDSYAAQAGEATLGAKFGDRMAHVRVRLAEGNIPIEVEVQGLGAPLDDTFSPAGSWHGRARQVFLTAADEVASENLVDTWVDTKGTQIPISVEGVPPYRVRMGPDLYTVDLERAERPADLVLVPAGASGRSWGMALRGKNIMERIPYACASEGEKPACHSDGPPERLRRLGARANVQ